jgi:hypothetical protein
MRWRDHGLSRGIAQFVALLALCSLAQAQTSEPKTIEDGSAPGEQAKVAETVQLCDLLKNPFAYQHKLVRVRGLVVRDFESFLLESPHCTDMLPLWIEYGGPNPADGPAWHGELKHPPDGKGTLWVEGVRTSLEADAKFRKFDALTKSLKFRHKARATLVGLVFSSGTYKDENGQEQEVGYGLYGMYSLFVLQKVEAVSRN